MPIKKEITKKDKDVNDKIMEISYKIKFIDNFRFMSRLLSNLVSNQLIFRCFECKKTYEKDFNKELIKRFGNIYGFCNGDTNKFILLLRKGVIHMNTWI